MQHEGGTGGTKGATKRRKVPRFWNGISHKASLDGQLWRLVYAHLKNDQATDSRQGVASTFSCPFAFTRDFGLSLVRNLPPRSQRENDRMLFHDSKNLFLST